ncbi:MAG: hypothetical protein ABI321_14905 [Polyangia bacterium]
MLALLLAMTAVAHAEPEDKQRARVLLADGNARYAAADFVDALRLFREAFAAYPSAKLLVNTAACERALGRVDRAASDLDEFLRRTHREDDHQLVENAREELHGLRDTLGRISWTDARGGDTLRVDGAVGWTTEWVRPGVHHVRLEHAGAAPYEASVVVEAGGCIYVALPVVVASPVVTPHRRARWIVPVAITGGVVGVALGLGLGLGLGLHSSPATLHGSLGTVTFAGQP